MHAIGVILSICSLSCLGTIDYISTVTLPMSPKFRKQNEDLENWTSEEMNKLIHKEPRTKEENARLNRLSNLQISLNRYRDLNQEYESWIVEFAKDKEGGSIPSKITERSAILVNDWGAIQKTAEDLGYSEKSQESRTLQESDPPTIRN
jgi:hypothetical protein